MTLPPLSLYVHIPWCVKKCPYCDFNSHASNNIPEQAYTEQLLRDLVQELPHVQGRKLTSIFFGGGTPSLFSAQSIGAVIQKAQALIGFEDNIEITLECNPGTAEYGSIQGYLSAGVNRISLGVQSFNDDHLRTLGRIHSSAEVINAYQLCRRAGCLNINLDLMHGLPQQTVTQALNDLQCAIDLAPNHISWYQLTLEPNTAFYSDPPVLPVDDLLSDIQDEGHALLTRHFFAQYEISAYSQPTQQARHNLNYWQFGDYLAIGAGAHGKITLPHQGLLRYWKTRQPKDYLNPEANAVGSKIIEPQDQLFEFMMNALRLVDGVPSDYLAQRTQVPAEQASQTVQIAQQKGLIQNRSDRLVTTPLGLRFLNDTLQIFQ